VKPLAMPGILKIPLKFNNLNQTASKNALVAQRPQLATAIADTRHLLEGDRVGGGKTRKTRSFHPWILCVNVQP
jgi:hypothetical protein